MSWIKSTVSSRADTRDSSLSQVPEKYSVIALNYLTSSLENGADPPRNSRRDEGTMQIEYRIVYSMTTKGVAFENGSEPRVDTSVVFHHYI